MAMAIVVKGMQGISAKLNDTNRIKKPQVDFLSRVSIDIRRRASENSPVATGNLRNSWAYKIDTGRREATIGTPLFYARPLEMSTTKKPRGVGIIPFFKPAIDEATRGMDKFIKVMKDDIEKEYKKK